MEEDNQNLTFDQIFKESKDNKPISHFMKRVRGEEPDYKLPLTLPIVV